MRRLPGKVDPKIKEYKSFTIRTRELSRIGSKLNECAKDGWYIKDTISKHIAEAGYTHQFIYLLERENNKVTISGDDFTGIRELKENIPKPPPPPSPPLGRKITER